MRQRVLGPGAPAVSAVGYGGMHLSIEGRPSEEEGIAVIQAALDAGVTLVDTADVYCLDQHDIGHNERLIARRWRRPGAGDRVTVAWPPRAGSSGPAAAGTVTPARRSSVRPANGRSARSASSGSTCTSCTRPIRACRSPRAWASWRGFASEGKVRWVGLSNVSVAEIREAQAIVPITSVQNRLNPFFREALSGGVVRYCAEQGIGFLAYSPTGGGRLTRKLPAHPVLAHDRARLGGVGPRGGAGLGAGAVARPSS